MLNSPSQVPGHIPENALITDYGNNMQNDPESERLHGRNQMNNLMSQTGYNVPAKAKGNNLFHN